MLFNTYNEYPYTTFQDINLDWILKTVKELELRVKTLEDNLVEQINSIVADTLDDFKTDVLKEITNGLNDVNARLTEFEKQITNDINVRFNAQDTRIESNREWTALQISQIKTDFAELQKYVDMRVLEIQNSVSDIWDGLGEYKENVNEMLRVQLNNMYVYIDEHIQSITRLYVINPITGQYEDIQDVLNMFVQYLTAGLGLTAQEYDDLQLTAFEYDSMHITAINYIVRGLYMFYPKLYLRMLSPFTGKMGDYSTIIYALSDFHKNSWKCYEYDMFEITAEDYDSRQIRAYDFDWNSKHWIAGTPQSAAYTAAEYDSLNITAADYDGLYITATEFDIASKIFLRRITQ